MRRRLQVEGGTGRRGGRQWELLGNYVYLLSPVVVVVCCVLCVVCSVCGVGVMPLISRMTLHLTTTAVRGVCFVQPWLLHLSPPLIPHTPSSPLGLRHLQPRRDYSHEPHNEPHSLRPHFEVSFVATTT